MDIAKKMCSVSSKSIKYEDTVEQTVESEITLPEYFPDIVSVLRCTLKPNIVQTRFQSNKLTVEGTSLISIVYLCEERKLHCFEQRIPFVKTADIIKAENCYAVSDAETQFVNCRVSSQRKISIHASVSVCYKLFFNDKREILSDCEENSIQMKKDFGSAAVLRDCQLKSFVINETVEIGSAQESIGQILRSDAVALLDSVKMVSGKALIKGELKVKLTYLTDKECSIEKAESSMPISQIVELDSDEDSTEYITLSVGSIDVFAKTDSSGALRMFDISVCVNAEIDVYDEKEIECVIDSYSTEYELKQKKEIVPFIKISEKISDTFLLRGSIEYNEEKIKSILDINTKKITYSSNVVNNELVINGTLEVGTIILNDENEIISSDKEMNFEYITDVKTENTNCNMKFNLVVTSMNFIINDVSKLDIRAEIDINGIIFDGYEKEIITDISIDENEKKIKNNASLTIYFSDAGESVWNIAKRYNTTVKAISEENKLNDDLVKERKKLLIPCM